MEDQQEAVEFWTQKVGFVVQRDQPMGPKASWIEVGPKDAESCLVIYPKSMMPNYQELKRSIVFLCDDIETTYEQLKANGVRPICRW